MSKMKSSVVSVILMLLLPLSLFGEKWEFNRFNVFFENDLFSTTDSQYSSGEKFSLIYHVINHSNPLYELLYLDYGEYDAYVSFSLVNQMYTPADLSETALIEDDRPYAGWTYLEYAIHKSSQTDLRSLYLHVGMVGPASRTEEIQEIIHEMTDSTPPKGWDNQLQNELGINLKYVHKWRFVPEPLGSFETSYVPFVQGDLGNVAIGATGGVSARFGWNIPKDFGVSTIDSGGEVGVLVLDECENMRREKWSFSFNLNGYGSAVAHDIFLDGNTFKDSHSVDKENFVGYLGFGFTARYENIVFDFMQTKSTPKFTGEDKIHTVGTAVLSWLY
ncbi:MAG: lipid A deacylase LpxR family protein [Campylobacterota bacterium]|nr:lipid A deacylase LpxR family protein [Campylobacterota bacterium]